MKTFYSQHQINYSSYTFSYSVYAVREPDDRISDIYNQGFLPYTGDLSIERDIFYLARSVRVDLERFKITSENRRVDRIASALAIRVEPIRKENFNGADPNFLSFCSKFASARFHGGKMDPERILYIFKRKMLTHILVFQSIERTYGYVFAGIHENMLHYWYAFFDLAFLQSHSLGKYMMWRTIRWAKDKNLNHVYLGTCYGRRSLYKIRDHKGIEFFDGCRWNQNVDLLKLLCQIDEEQKYPDRDLLKSDEGKLRAIFREALKI
ncbi:MAG: GNAT family N-acetyltransferase [Calditrichaeota bacterium]|nr:GNAT family N-acetyltransferase [Calditrichota bacterium]